ncbi:MAG TPA: type II secretion system F family protein [Vicinamibacterales bacterium]|nr:type II secretion system F family protein [Vicinamibacterales bacterium]
MGTTEIIMLAVFAGTALLIAGPYWLFIARSEAATQASLRKRVRPTAPVAVTTAGGGVLQEVEQLSGIGPLNALLGRSERLSAGLSRMIHQAGLNLKVGQVLLGSACLALAADVIVIRYTYIWWTGAMAGVAFFAVPFGVINFLRNRRMNKFEEQFPEAIDLIARTLRAGHAFATGLKLAADELPQPVGDEFQLLHDQINYGMPVPEALKGFAKRVPIIDARFFVTAVLTQREAGGNLAEVLDNLSSVIRERFKIKRQLRVISAHGRLTGAMLTCLPIALAIMLAIQVPDHFGVLWRDAFGRKLIYYAIFLQISGALLIRKITTVQY